VFIGSNRLLLVKRGQEPGIGKWSLPGGRCRPGEPAAAAAVRETREETGLVVTSGLLIGQIEIPGPEGVIYAVTDYACTITGGELRAGDDAADARFVPLNALARLPLTAGLLDTLRRWKVV
jgi:ADP-ribose pyrophosphatase YjhB (NUDIX family)